MKKPITQWVVYLKDRYPITIGYTRKQAVMSFMNDVGPKYTWEQMQQSGYTVHKSEIKPLINKSMGK
jgi:hypothetical protein